MGYLLSHLGVCLCEIPFIWYLALHYLLYSFSFYNCHKLPVPNLATGWGQVDHQKSYSDLRIESFYFLLKNGDFTILLACLYGFLLSSPPSN